MSKEPIDLHISDNAIIEFGKYKGTKYANVPAEYLLYMLDNNYIKFGPAYQYIKENEILLRGEGECDATESDLY